MYKSLLFLNLFKNFLQHGILKISIIHPKAGTQNTSLGLQSARLLPRIPVLGKGHNKYPRREAAQEAIFICYTVLSFPSFLWQTLLAPQNLFSPSSFLILIPHPRIRLHIPASLATRCVHS